MVVEVVQGFRYILGLVAVSVVLVQLTVKVWGADDEPVFSRYVTMVKMVNTEMAFNVIFVAVG